MYIHVCVPAPWCGCRPRLPLLSLLSLSLSLLLSLLLLLLCSPAAESFAFLLLRLRFAGCAAFLGGDASVPASIFPARALALVRAFALPCVWGPTGPCPCRSLCSARWRHAREVAWGGKKQNG